MYPRVHPAMLAWWKARQAEGCGSTTSEAACGAHEAVHGHGHSPGGWHGRGERYEAAQHDDGGSFGVRRPLRFLAYKLDLSEPQVAELAKILGELKTERAQAAVDDRRVTAAFADAITGDTFDDAKAAEAATARAKTQEKLAGAVREALAKIHAQLDKEQRERLAYLIRTGTLSI